MEETVSNELLAKKDEEAVSASKDTAEASSSSSDLLRAPAFANAITPWGRTFITYSQLPTLVADEQKLRVDLCALYHLAHHFHWEEAVAEHMSVRTTPSSVMDPYKQEYLIGPKWIHFRTLRPHHMMKLDTSRRSEAEVANLHIDPPAFVIHDHLHRLVPRARCIVHVHTKYALLLSCLEDNKIYPLDQNCTRFFNRVAHFRFRGITEPIHGMDIVNAFGSDKSVVIMENHGLLVIGPTVAHVFDTIYYLEKACESLVLAYQTGRKLRFIPDDVAEYTAQQWEHYSERSEWCQAHFEEMKKVIGFDY